MIFYRWIKKKNILVYLVVKKKFPRKFLISWYVSRYSVQFNYVGIAQEKGMLLFVPIVKRFDVIRTLRIEKSFATAVITHWKDIVKNCYKNKPFQIIIIIYFSLFTISCVFTIRQVGIAYENTLNVPDKNTARTIRHRSTGASSFGKVFRKR